MIIVFVVLSNDFNSHKTILFYAELLFGKALN